MAYAYYQQAYPTWGTSQFQFGPPPAPTFQPDAAWSGWDYYRAHAVNPSRSMFYSVMDRIRGYGFDGSPYVSTHEARSIHLRLYGGFLSLNRVMPKEIGMAAAYEAYRTWKHHRSLLQPLGGHSVREREALIGLAAAETSHLWQYSGRSADLYGLQDALETAALTASRFYDRKADKLTTRASTPIYARDYAYTRGRRHSSTPAVVRAGSDSPYIGGGPGVALGPASVGGTPLSGNVGLGGSTPMSGYNALPRGSPYGGAAGMPLPAVQYGGGAYTAPAVAPAVNGMPQPQPQVQYANAGGYPQGYNYGQQQQPPIVIQQAPSQPYGQYGYGGGRGYYGGNQGYASSNRPIVIDASGHSSSRRHGHHHHRSRSVEPVGRHGYHRHGRYF